MRYAILKNSNGAFLIDSEWTDLEKAKAQYHKVCQAHWNAKDVIKATITLVDENFFQIENYREVITHTVEPTEEVTE